MIFEIDNGILAVKIDTNGAELQSIFNKVTGLEYLWDANPNFWAKKSPVLFPIVGGLKNNQYIYKGKTYQLNRHGFAREMEFSVSEHSGTNIVFTIKSTIETKAKYPFDFIFSIHYSLISNKLSIVYIVENMGKENMFFSVGAHPAFKIPLLKETTFGDYFLQFSHTENACRWPLSVDGLIETKPQPFLDITNKLPLQKQLFYKDALVFKCLESNCISILSHKTTHGLKLNFEGFPFMGIWSAKEADFVCIEPWCGIADHLNTKGILVEKEGINMLTPAKVFERIWTVELF